LRRYGLALFAALVLALSLGAPPAANAGAPAQTVPPSPCSPSCHTTDCLCDNEVGWFKFIQIEPGLTALNFSV
jgi:hypothetical protein